MRTAAPGASTSPFETVAFGDLLRVKSNQCSENLHLLIPRSDRKAASRRMAAARQEGETVHAR